MSQFPIMLLLNEIGSLTWEREGLYYRFQGRITRSTDGFPRLYLHQEDGCVSLGVFSPQGELCGKIAVNKVQNLNLHFSLTKTRWHPKLGSIASTETARGEMLFLHRYEPLPSEILPYVCFLRPVTIENLPGLTVTLDKQGRFPLG